VCTFCNWACPKGAAPDLVPAALPLAEVRATMRALRSYLGELYPTARQLMTIGIDHIEAACDEMEGVPDA